VRVPVVVVQALELAFALAAQGWALVPELVLELWSY